MGMICVRVLFSGEFSEVAGRSGWVAIRGLRMVFRLLAWWGRAVAWVLGKALDLDVFLDVCDRRLDLLCF